MKHVEQLHNMFFNIMSAKKLDSVPVDMDSELVLLFPAHLSRSQLQRMTPNLNARALKARRQAQRVARLQRAARARKQLLERSQTLAQALALQLVRAHQAESESDSLG